MTKGLWWLFFASTIVYIVGFDTTVMDVDSAQYASISREMAETNEYLQVKHRGEDYLDKPPLLFWISSLSFEIFGFHNWSFKIGSFLFTLLGVFSTYRLGKILYNKQVGAIAALILYSCQAFFLFNNDVRTDTILTGTVIFAIWQWVEWLKDRKWKWLFGLSIGIALAMLAKGPIGLMVPVLAVGGYIIGKRAWKDIFRWQYLVMLMGVALLIFPMLYGLYHQYDLQPEKITKMVSPQGLKPVKGVSGIKFYLWTQSFGRISGENVWKDSSGPFFFVHNFLWSFLPWSLLFIPALFYRMASLFKKPKIPDEKQEWLTTIGFLLPYLVLSTSSYKLPHYIFPLYPLAAIILASWWIEVVAKKAKKSQNLALVLQVLVFTASLSIVAVIFFYFFPGQSLLWCSLSAVSFVFSFRFLVNFRYKNNFIYSVVLLSIGVNFTMNGWFYPKLIQYQGGSQMAAKIAEYDIPSQDIFVYSYYSFSYNYYHKGKTQLLSETEFLQRKDEGKLSYLITNIDVKKALERNYLVSVIDSVQEHAVTRLTLPFLAEKTRKDELKKLFLLKVQ